MQIRKLAAMILVVSMLSAVFNVARATESDEGTTAASVTQEQVTADITEEETETTTAVEEELSEEKDVAEISICTRASGFPAFFHVWIYVHNISDETLRVGVYDLPPDEGVSIGSWGMMFTDLWGIYYNVEAYASDDRDAGDYFALTKTLNAEETEKMSREVSRFNWWDPIFNCTVFAYRVWNVAGGKWLFPVPLPWITQIEMAILGGKVNSLEMFCPEEDQVFRQKGWGDEAVLVQPDDWALKSVVAEFKGEKTEVTA